MATTNLGIPEVPTFDPNSFGKSSNPTGVAVFGLAKGAVSLGYAPIVEVLPGIPAPIRAFIIGEKIVADTLATYGALTSATGARPHGHALVDLGLTAGGYFLGGVVLGLSEFGTAGLATFLPLAYDLFVSAGPPFPNLAGMPTIYDRALSHPTGPEAAYSHALGTGNRSAIAHAAMNIPGVYPDAILRAAAGTGEVVAGIRTSR